MTVKTKKELFLTQLLAAMPANVYLKDINGIYLECSDLQAHLVGYKNGKDIVGKTDYDLIAKEEADIIRAIDVEVMQQKKIHVIEETVHLPKTGKTTFLSRKTPLYDEHQNVIGLLGISFDITKEKTLEKELLETNAKLAKSEKETIKYLSLTNKEITGTALKTESSIQELTQNIKNYYEQLVAALPGHVYWMTRDNVFLGCNDLQAKHAGLASRYEIVGKTNFDMPWKDQAAALDALNNKVMETGIPHIAEEFAKMSYGDAYFLSNKIPLFSKSGNVIGVLGISLDITDRKHAEQLEREKVLDEQKIQFLRELAATIAHELRTPLSGIALTRDLIKIAVTKMTEAIEKDYPDFYAEKIDAIANETAKYFDQISDIIKRSSTTISLLLHNIKEENIGKQAFKITSIDEDIKTVLQNYPFASDEKEKIEYDAAGAFEYLGDTNLTQLVITNLIKNSLYHIKLKDGAKIRISFKSTKESNSLIFYDSGPGISKEMLPKIFDRFVSGSAGGTGLGLAFCKMVMHAYDGDITCDSKEGKYTSFKLTFPALKK